MEAMADMTARETLAQLDVLMPYRGPCAFCGDPDARHREWESWREMALLGRRDSLIAYEFDRPQSVIQLITSLTWQQHGALLRATRARRGKGETA